VVGVNTAEGTPQRGIDWWMHEVGLDLALIAHACIGALLTGFTVVYIGELTLPPSDGAYGLGLLIFLDPFVTSVMLMGCAMGAMYALVLGRLLLADCNIHRAALLVDAIVLPAVAVGTLVLQMVGGMLAAFAALTVSMVLCRVLPWRFIKRRHESTPASSLASSRP
jgi:hypothetical protein